jgi:hypothetical protein
LEVGIVRDRAANSTEIYGKDPSELLSSELEMNADNPYEAPEDTVAGSTPARHVSKIIGTCVLVAGSAILAYGATAFWLIKTLPPNGGANGRLPSLYVMGAGIVVAVLGLVARDLRVSRKEDRSAGVSRNGIPASYGILILLAIMIIFFVVVSRL